MNLMNQKQFAAYYGGSQPLISKFIRDGKIPESCLVRKGRSVKIKPHEAMEALEKNLDPAFRKQSVPKNGNGNENDIQDDYDLTKAIKSIQADERRLYEKINPADPETILLEVQYALNLLLVCSGFLKPEIESVIESSAYGIARALGGKIIDVEDLGERFVYNQE